MILKKVLFLALGMLPGFIYGCSCLWFTSFCENITPQSIVSTVKIIDDFYETDTWEGYFIKVAVIENLRGTPQKDTFTILASANSSCDISPSRLNVGDTLVANIGGEPSDWFSTPHDFYLQTGCSEPFLLLKNRNVFGIYHSTQPPQDYRVFKNKIADCAKQTIYDDPKKLEFLLKIFPNPTVDDLNIELRGTDNFVYTIFDARGRKIAEDNISDWRTTLNTTGWQPGIYIVKIKTAGAELTKRIVKI